MKQSSFPPSKMKTINKNKPIFQFSLSFLLSNPFSPQTVTIAIAITIHPNDWRQHMWSSPSPALAARGGNGGGGKPQQSREHLAVAARKSPPPACTPQQL
jgi:hypothetical protein